MFDNIRNRAALLQNMVAKLWGNKHTHPNSLLFITANTREINSPAPLKRLGSRARAVRESEPDYI